jgi:mRNA export factor
LLAASAAIQFCEYRHEQQLLAMALFGATTPATTGTGAQGDITKDVAVKEPPEDSISGLAFSPTHDYLAVSSWDKKVRIYDIDSQGNSKGLAMWEHDGPALSVTWSKVCGFVTKSYICIS